MKTVIIYTNNIGENKMRKRKMENIYANQWCSLWEDYTVAEKMKRDGEINSLMTGGSITHFSVDSKLTSQQAKMMINKAINNGAEHFALNCVYTECKECHKVEKGNFDKCPHCESKRLAHFSRIIGYFSQIENWNPTRRTEDFPNRKFIKNEMLKEQICS